MTVACRGDAGEACARLDLTPECLARHRRILGAPRPE